MSIEQKIVELLAESAKMKGLELEAKDKIKKDKMKDSEEVCEDLEEAKKSKKKTSKKDYYSNDSDDDEDDSKDYFFDKKKVQKESFNLEDYTLEELEDFMVSEDFEQLDELSKKTLSSYIKKASGNGENSNSSLASRAMEKYKGGDNGYDYDDEGHDDAKKSIRRSKGISKAVDKLTKESADIQEDIDALLFGEELTEDFKVKATTIFEAAVLSRVKTEVADLQEAFDARLDEEAVQAKEEITEKVDGYLSYVVEQWMGDNELAIVNGLKSDILEGFVGGLKSLFQEHYIEVPEEKFDVVGDLQTQVDFLESKLDESLEANVSMKKHLSEMVRDNIIEDYCYGLTDTEAEKFKSLAEEIGFQNEDTFSSKLEIIKENYFTKKEKTRTASVVTDAPISLNEDTKHVDQNVARYLETFTKINIK